jgi:hypothetical protein
MTDYLDINTLKTLGTPYYFGLGFIQLKITPETRLHFYHPEIMPILDEDEIHDHRYDFVSKIIKGRLENEIYDYQRLFFADYELVEVSCKKEDAGKPPQYLHEVEPYKVCSFSCSAGDSYALPHYMFHKIRYPVPTITLLTRGEIVKEFAHVIKHKEAPSVCPFSKKMSDEEIWSIIEEIVSF